MSQFLLVQDVDFSLLPQTFEVVPVGKDEFLKAAGIQIFGAESADKLMAVIFDGDDFDTIFLKAQRDLVEGKDYNSTTLSELLNILSKTAKRFALWYGNDYNDLETVDDIKELTRVICEGLSEPSVEVYAMFESY